MNSDLFPVPDWYEVHYLSVCFGKWETGSDQTVKDTSSRTCVRQNPGYTFSLDEVLSQAQDNSSLTGRSMSAESTWNPTLETAVPIGLLMAGIACAGLSALLMVYSILALKIKGTPPLFLMRVSYLASIPAAIFFTISSAKVTVLAGRLTGTWTSRYRVAINAWKGTGFYAETWAVVALIWLAVGVSIATAFSLANQLTGSRHVKWGA